MLRKSRWVLALLFCFMLVACSSNDEQSSNESSGDSGESLEESTSNKAATNGLSETPAAEDTSQTIPESTEEKMMVYEAHIELETEDYDQFYQSLQTRMEENEAYIIET
ncbi:hypothetical protein LD39_12755, partial [Halobacillus sp. BBL2006]